MPDPFYLNIDLELSVPFQDKDRASSLGAFPIYDSNRKFKCWAVRNGQDVLPFREFWTAHFSNWYRENVSKEEVLLEGVRLSNVLKIVKQAIKNAFQSSIWIEAEIIDVKFGNHTYLEIAEYDDQGREVAKGRAAIFAGNSHIIKRFEETTGMKLGPKMKVLFKASVEFHEQYGMSLVINDFEPRFTIGDMEAKIAKIISTLIAEGVIDKNKRKAFPFDYNKVAVIAPDQAAGLGDFRTQADLLAKHELCHFDYFFAQFQGNNAVGMICEKLDEIARKSYMGSNYDAVVIIRGGGDKAGLYAMNDIEIARRVCLFPIPVIVGIGHDRDETILDGLACIRRPTPSLVISGISNDIVNSATSAKKAMDDLSKISIQTITRHKEKLASAAFEIKSSASALISRAQQDTDMEMERLRNSTFKTLSSATSTTKELVAGVFYRDPTKVLSQGYAIVRNEHKKAIGKVESINDGSSITLEMKDGLIKANVIKIKQHIKG